MRLFVAIDLDDAARSALAAEQARVRLEAEPSLRWVRPEQLHLTIVFIGEADEATAASVREELSRPVAHPPFQVTFAGLGVFPRRGPSRALWIGLQEGYKELCELQAVIAARLRARGVPLESRPFRPHLTIARFKSARAADGRQLVARAGARTGVVSLLVDHATLYHSRVSSAGSTYTPLARATLKN